MGDTIDDLIGMFRQLWAETNWPCKCECLGGIGVGLPPDVCPYCKQPGVAQPNPADALLEKVNWLRVARPGCGNLAGIFGKWPGDETDEEIQQALKEMG